jgi:hypothetical protein
MMKSCKRSKKKAQSHNHPLLSALSSQNPRAVDEAEVNLPFNRNDLLARHRKRSIWRRSVKAIWNFKLS